ncbi:MAG: hypothetical protein ACC628_18220 [Pirellulaceae bacterium]
MNRRIRDRSVFFLGGLVAISLLGCGTSYDGPPRAKVSGSVTFDGKAIANGVINLMPDGHDGRVVSVPITDGQYRIEERDGPNFGKYKVEILGNEGGAVAAGKNPEEDSETAEAEDGERQIVPAKYNNETTLTLDVNQSVIEKDFALTP